MSAFLGGRVPFSGIADVVERTLETVDGSPARDLVELVASDAASCASSEAALQREVVRMP
ncbi:hypothetical protein BH18ACT13_BH18ACT13_19370 [soil metagenome]